VKIDGGFDERRSLERRAPAAAVAGALVPQPISLDGAPPDAVAVTLLDGRPASTAIAARSVSADDVLARVTAWLERWNLATAAAATVDERLLGQEVLAPSALLEPVLPDGRRYRSWLEERSRAWLGAELPLVDAHLDLTMTNVLLRPGGGIAIVDWAEARGGCLPLVDLLYAAADAVAAANSYRDRAAAFRGASYDRLVRVHEERIARALGLQPAVRELCMHACWLHHACNELRAGATTTPFRHIVVEIARRVTAGA
jgi:hypothetical protein